MLNGMDFSDGSGISAAAIKAGQSGHPGCAFVCRYLSNPGNPKNIDSAELANYKAAGIAVVFNYEYSGTDMTSFANGVADAQSSQAQLNALASAIHDSSVSDAPVFFSADEQTEADMTDYMRGVASVLGKSRTGIYGGLGTVSAAFNQGLVAYGWQTYAWSGGQWDNRALLRQVLNAVQFGPAQVDLDQAAYWGSSKVLTTADDYGQWPKSGPTPPPSKGPYRQEVPAGNTLTLNAMLRQRGASWATVNSLTLATASGPNQAIWTDFNTLNGSLHAAGKPEAVMPEGLVYYTVNP